ncbi:MAG: FAD-dependent oxidoreductase [Dehalococcoidales bacterium]|nr:FAD-dependent oxidoreductase [Dehalococcoidales bacterium]
METITINIDGCEVKTEKGKTVLQAALDAGIYIPNLCYHPDLTAFGGCRLCIVEIEGMRGLPTACTTLAAEGITVKTRTQQIDNVRHMTMELILASHPADCLVCKQNLNCELQAVAQYLGITEKRLRSQTKDIPVNIDNPLFDHDLSKCILCGRCVRACYDLRGAGVLSFINRGKETYVGTAFDHSLADAACIFCGACVEVCPTGALRDKDGLLVEGSRREETLVPCKYNCPAEINVPRYIRFIQQKKYSEATAVIREKVPFPNVLGNVCTHPCEMVCRSSELNEAISIRLLKRFAAERDEKLWKKHSQKALPTGKKIAIIGSGPAGLTAAYYLSKLGHSITVYEALPVIGGMMRVGIPEYRLSSDILDAEIEEIKQIGFDIKVNTRIESLGNLFEKGYSAVYVATGAHQNARMGVEGEDANGVIDAISFLREVSLGYTVELGSKVAVIGGGNVAIDVARTALRLNAKDVTIIYRRTRAEMPANTEEVEGALEEGINIVYLTAPNKIENKNGIVSLKCIRMELGEPDASGRRRPVPISDSEFIINYDNVITAIGQISDIPEGYQLSRGRGGVIETDKTSATSRKGVFAGGDVVSGPATVIEAIAGGRKGAINIDRYLGGNGIIDEELIPAEEYEDCVGRKEGMFYQHRCEMTNIPVEERLNNFKEVEMGCDEGAALKESWRCLQCDLRLSISSVKLPPKKYSIKGVGKGN